MRLIKLLLLLIVTTLPGLGCSKTDSAPASTPDQERQMEQQLEAARKAEGAAQKTP